jgi:hypothetical protein
MSGMRQHFARISGCYREGQKRGVFVIGNFARACALLIAPHTKARVAIENFAAG